MSFILCDLLKGFLNHTEEFSDNLIDLEEILFRKQLWYAYWPYNKQNYGF